MGLSWFSSVHLLGALILLFIATPFMDRPPYGEGIEAIALTLVLLCAMLAVGGNRRTLLIGGALLVPALAAKWLAYARPDLVPVWFVPALGILFMSFVLWHLFRFTVGAPQVTREVVCAGVSAYLIMGVMWAVAYTLAAKLEDNSFALFGQPVGPPDVQSMFYFSFITQIGIGYGDYTPLSATTRMMTVVQGLGGLLFVAIFISRLVAQYTPGTRESGAQKEA